MIGCCSVTKSCLTLCGPMDRGTPGFLVLPWSLLKFTWIELVQWFIRTHIEGKDAFWNLLEPLLTCTGSVPQGRSPASHPGLPTRLRAIPRSRRAGGQEPGEGSAQCLQPCCRFPMYLKVPKFSLFSVDLKRSTLLSSLRSFWPKLASPPGGSDRHQDTPFALYSWNWPGNNGSWSSQFSSVSRDW